MKRDYKIKTLISYDKKIRVSCFDIDYKLLSKAILDSSQNCSVLSFINSLIEDEEGYLSEEYNILKDNKDTLLEYDEGNLKYLYEIKAQVSLLEDKLSNGIFIDCITAKNSGTGAGTFIVNYLKEKYDFIILYSIMDSEDYWAKQNFKCFYDGYYIFDKNNILDFFYK